MNYDRASVSSLMRLFRRFLIPNPVVYFRTWGRNEIRRSRSLRGWRGSTVRRATRCCAPTCLWSGECRLEIRWARWPGWWATRSSGLGTSQDVTSPKGLRVLAIADTAIPEPGGGLCSTRRDKRNVERRWRVRRRAEVCGTGRRWRAGSSRGLGWRRSMPSEASST